MKFIFKIAAVLVVVILLISSIYVISSIDDEDKNGESDNDPPTIDFVTCDTTGTTVKITTIYVTFSDNVGVTTAIIYYKKASDDS